MRKGEQRLYANIQESCYLLQLLTKSQKTNRKLMIILLEIHRSFALYDHIRQEF